MPSDSKRIWVCTTGKHCCDRKPKKVLKALKESAKKQGVSERFEIVECGCVGMCGLGPNALVMSGRTRFGYSHLTANDAGEIIAAHTDQDTPVERLKTKRS